jgi:hypothetical protein
LLRTNPQSSLAQLVDFPVAEGTAPRSQNAQSGLDALLSMLRAKTASELFDATSRLGIVIANAPTPTMTAAAATASTGPSPTTAALAQALAESESADTSYLLPDGKLGIQGLGLPSALAVHSAAQSFGAMGSGSTPGAPLPPSLAHLTSGRGSSGGSSGGYGSLGSAQLSGSQLGAQFSAQLSGINYADLLTPNFARSLLAPGGMGLQSATAAPMDMSMPIAQITPINAAAHAALGGGHVAQAAAIHAAAAAVQGSAQGGSAGELGHGEPKRVRRSERSGSSSAPPAHRGGGGSAFVGALPTVPPAAAASPLGSSLHQGGAAGAMLPPRSSPSKRGGTRSGGGEGFGTVATSGGVPAAEGIAASSLRKKRPMGATDLMLVRPASSSSDSAAKVGAATGGDGASGSSGQLNLSAGQLSASVSIGQMLEAPLDIQQFSAQLSPHLGLTPTAFFDFLATDDVSGQTQILKSQNLHTWSPTPRLAGNRCNPGRRSLRRGGAGGGGGDEVSWWIAWRWWGAALEWRETDSWGSRS